MSLMSYFKHLNHSRRQWDRTSLAERASAHALRNVKNPTNKGEVQSYTHFLFYCLVLLDGHTFGKHSDLVGIDISRPL